MANINKQKNKITLQEQNSSDTLKRRLLFSLLILLPVPLIASSLGIFLMYRWSLWNSFIRVVFTIVWILGTLFVIDQTGFYGLAFL